MTEEEKIKKVEEVLATADAEAEAMEKSMEFISESYRESAKFSFNKANENNDFTIEFMLKVAVGEIALVVSNALFLDGDPKTAAWGIGFIMVSVLSGIIQKLSDGRFFEKLGVSEAGIGTHASIYVAGMSKAKSYVAVSDALSKNSKLPKRSDEWALLAQFLCLVAGSIFVVGGFIAPLF